MSYCKSYFNYKRRDTVTAQIGALAMGGAFPIRIQTMANTDTNAIDASVQQSVEVVKAGAELLRFTTQGVKEATALGQIHAQLRGQGIEIPLVADVHFNPKVAEVAAQLVEKVRINPGNFVASQEGEYSDEAYDEELNRIEEKLLPLLVICKEHGTALRIGVNHGSLSPRIVSRYGDTPEGLAISCMEFVQLCVKHGFENLVISVKASNTLVMVQAVRLLVAKMEQMGVQVPLHLGVTEAGNGEDGRIKSAVGIGALLADGIGDTIRVSLSEHPAKEIPVAGTLAHYVSVREGHAAISAQSFEGFNPYRYSRRKSDVVGMVGGNRVPVVLTKSDAKMEPMPDLQVNGGDYHLLPLTLGGLDDAMLSRLREEPQAVILLSSSHQNRVGEMRAFFHTLLRNGVTNPVILHGVYDEAELETFQIKAAADMGALFLDGFGDGIYLENRRNSLTDAEINSTAFGILQAARVRMSRTEYISCPGCGRTLFDLERTIDKVKAATGHLKELKIAVMGCVVNGPGEMADADYGYVGAGKGRVSLYRGQECIEKNLPEEEAVEHLLTLIASDTMLSHE